MQMKGQQKINHPNLSDEAYSILAKRIIGREFSAGVRLVETKLARDLGISRTPIREALNRLVQDGLIDLVPRKGAQVIQLKAKDVEEIYELRKVLEGFATEKATLLIKEKDLHQIKELMEKGESSSEKKLEYYLNSDLKLHNLIINHCGNSRLIKILRNLQNFIHSFRILDAQYGQRIKQAHEDHKAILKALSKKDARAARVLMEQHTENAKKNILADFEFKGGKISESKRTSEFCQWTVGKVGIRKNLC